MRSRRRNPRTAVATYALLWLAGAAAVVAVAVVLLDAGGDDDVMLPPVQGTRLADAASAAGCQFTRARADAGLNPPVDGPLTAPAARPGYYEDAPPVAGLVAALRRGIIVIHVRADVADESADLLKRMQSALPEGTIVTPNATQMRFAIAATAYRRLLGCRSLDGRSLDALRLFRGRFVGTGAGR